MVISFSLSCEKPPVLYYYFIGGLHKIIYGVPESKIILETIVLEDKIRECLINDSRFFINKKIEEDFIENKIKNKSHIRLKAVKYFEQDTCKMLTLGKLKENGYKGNMQGSVKLDNNWELHNYIKNVIS